MRIQLAALLCTLALSFTLGACGDDDGGSTAIDAASTIDGGPVIDGGPAADADVPNACKTAGGVCVGAAADCEAGSGTVLAAGAAGCVFSDGQGVCCEPPAPAANGNGCDDQGGVCAPIAGCGFVDGSFANATPACDGNGVGTVCCLPEAICGVEDKVCCAAGPAADFRPSCDRGTFDCSDYPGTELLPLAECPE